MLIQTTIECKISWFETRGRLANANLLMTFFSKNCVFILRRFDYLEVPLCRLKVRRKRQAGKRCLATLQAVSIQAQCVACSRIVVCASSCLIGIY